MEECKGYRFGLACDGTFCGESSTQGKILRLFRIFKLFRHRASYESGMGSRFTEKKVNKKGNRRSIKSEA